MTLGSKQRLFTRLVARLITWVYDEYGAELTFGEAWRSPEEQSRIGHLNSNHGIRLAVDFNLFRNGIWLKGTEDHKAIGEYWEFLNPQCYWGGRFQDGNHYSIIHDGRK